ncbi:MAG: ORF6N domain-containing protein [Salinivirgaceae bacterium]|nr:ORF6N domain-containing protein [Salinivirgaceae bacterium]
MVEDNKQLIPSEQIMNKIFLLRDEKVMLDVHLAEIYDFETRALKQAVRRNMELFPDDFMFVLNDVEIDIMVSQNVTPSKQHLGGSKPFVFTETGVAMLSSVLKSKRAREMNVAIMCAFVALRKMLLNHTEMKIEIESIKKKLENQDKNIELVFTYLDKLMEKHENRTQRKRIGFKKDNH